MRHGPFPHFFPRCGGALLAALLLAALPAAAAPDPAGPALAGADAERQLALAYAAQTQGNAGFVAGQAQAAAGGLSDPSGGVAVPTSEAFAIASALGAQAGQTVAFAGDSGSVWAQAAGATFGALSGQECSAVPTASGSLGACAVSCPTGGSLTVGTAPSFGCTLPLPGVPGAPAAADPGAPTVTLSASPAGAFLRGAVALTAEARNTVQVSSVTLTDNGQALAEERYGNTSATRHLTVQATLAEGRHRLQARASGGVQEGVSAPMDVVMDATPPRSAAAFADGHPLEAAVLQGTVVVLSASDPRPPGVDAVSGAARISYRIYPAGQDAPPFSNATGAEAWLSATEAGPHLLDYYATDAAGNVEETRQATLDFTAAALPPPVPATPLPSVPPAGGPSQGAAPSPDIPEPAPANGDGPAAQEPAHGASHLPAASGQPLLLQPWPYAGLLALLSGFATYVAWVPRRIA